MISLGRVLIDSGLGGAIFTVYDDRDGRRRATCEGMRRRRLLRRLTRRKIASRYRTLSTEGAPGSPEASDVWDNDGGGPWPPLPPGGTAAMIQSCFDSLDGLRRAWRA